MKDFKLTYTRFSETSILVEWPQVIAPEILRDILAFKKNLLNYKFDSILQVLHGYASVLISYKLHIEDFELEVTALKSNYDSREDSDSKQHTLWKIPVCYESVFGLDLEAISREKKLTIPEIVNLHSETIYKIYFIGFLPGFLYLGSLDRHLFMPRKKSPRRRIEKGAVAIGGEQTGIYPNASPGGWNIIGNSPVSFFNPQLKDPCFAKPGDDIQFVSIDLKTHQEILDQVGNGTYKMESEVRDG